MTTTPAAPDAPDVAAALPAWQARNVTLAPGDSLTLTIPPDYPHAIRFLVPAPATWTITPAPTDPASTR